MRLALRPSPLALRLAAGLIQVVPAVMLLWYSFSAIVRPNWLDDLRRADQLFAAGRFHDALAAYQLLAQQAPDFALAHARAGMVMALRGEFDSASQALAFGLGLGLTGYDHDLTRLYQGRVAVGMGRPREAEQLWQTINQDAPLLPLRRALEAEQLLRAGDYAGAEAAFQAAPLDRLPDEWRMFVRTRLATLRAASDPAGALAALTAQAHSSIVALPPQVAALVAPLLPTSGPDATTLLVALRAEPDQRPQMLGQVYLDGGLYALAEAQFHLVASQSQSALAASAYAAYTRWLAGDRATGLARLNDLVAAHPQEPRARALLALAYLADDDAQSARAQLDTIRALAPRAPDTHLAWGQWYASQHDYLAAAAAYKRALDDAPAERRGIYALALARFHVDTDLDVCEAGQGAAEQATGLLPDQAGAWATLAAARFRCNNPAGARDAARQALEHDPASAEAAYYLGRALAALGDRPGARSALVSAADLAPNSSWRERAEKQLGILGL